MLGKYNENGIQQIKVNYPVHKNPSWSSSYIKFCVLQWDFIQVQTPATFRGSYLLC